MGGLIAKSLGLHDYDMRLVYDWMVKMLSEMREDVKPPVDAPESILGDYLNQHINNTVVVNGIIDARSNLVPMPTESPKGELLVRFEPDTKGLWVSAKSFKAFCVEQQINYKDILAQLKKAGIFKEAVNKRMSKGMKLDTPTIRALFFDTAVSEILQLTKDKDEDRVGDVQD